MSPIPRFLVPNHGPDNDKLRAAFIAGCGMCASSGASKLTLVTPRLDIDTNEVGKFFGLPVAKRLNAGENVKVGQTGLTMDYRSVATAKRGPYLQVVFACYLSLGTCSMSMGSRRTVSSI